MTRHGCQLLSRDSEMIGRMKVTWWIRLWLNFVLLTKAVNATSRWLVFFLSSLFWFHCVLCYSRKLFRKKKMWVFFFLFFLKNRMRSVGWYAFQYIFYFSLGLFKINFYLNGVKVVNETVLSLCTPRYGDFTE